MRNISLFACLVLLFFPPLVHAQAPLVLDGQQLDYLKIGNSLSLFADSTQAMTYDDVTNPATGVVFEPATSAVPNYGYKPLNIWFRFVLRDDSPEDMDWILELDKASVDTVELYFPQPDGSTLKKMHGDMFPPETREIRYRTFLFKLPLEKGEEQVVYGVIKGKFSKQLVLNIYEEYHFMELAHRTDAGWYLYFGLILALVIYNLFLLLVLQSRTYLYYTIYMAALIFSQIALSGFGQEFVWPHWYAFQHVSSMFFIAVATFAANQFAKYFLKVKQLAPRSYKLMFVNDITAGVLFIGCVVDLFYYEINLVVSQFSVLVLLTNIVILFYISIVIYLKRYRPARFYLIAWSSLFVGTIIAALRNMGVLPQTSFVANSIHYGSILEAFLLSLALADRVKIAEKERAEARESMIAALQENERLVTNQNKELERKVKERTQEISEKNQELEMQKEEISAQRDMLEDTKMELERKNENITSSINYAKRIQTAILPDQERIRAAFTDCFVFFRPRDIVSGDFYWFEEKDGKVMVAAVDCTGHGVPGAFMSLVGYNLLNEIVNLRGITEPGRVLDELHLGVQNVLNQRETQNRDGMDMAMLVLDKASGALQYAGAKNPLITITAEGNLSIIKGDKYPIGGFLKDASKTFTTHNLQPEAGAKYFIYSDGYQDQFGGDDGRKFMTVNFRKVLKEASALPSMANGHDLVEKTFDEWRGYHRQLDDILVMGFQVK